MTVDEKVKLILADACYADEIRDGDRLREDLSVDSLGLAELMIKIEEAFDIEFDVGELSPAGLLLVSDVIGLTKKYKGRSHAFFRAGEDEN